jgi:hypothetical protein
MSSDPNIPYFACTALTMLAKKSSRNKAAIRNGNGLALARRVKMTHSSEPQIAKSAEDLISALS